MAQTPPEGDAPVPPEGRERIGFVDTMVRYIQIVDACRHGQVVADQLQPELLSQIRADRSSAVGYLLENPELQAVLQSVIAHASLEQDFRTRMERGMIGSVASSGMSARSLPEATSASNGNSGAEQSSSSNDGSAPAVGSTSSRERRSPSDDGAASSAGNLSSGACGAPPEERVCREASGGDGSHSVAGHLTSDARGPRSEESRSEEASNSVSSSGARSLSPGGGTTNGGSDCSSASANSTLVYSFASPPLSTTVTSVTVYNVPRGYTQDELIELWSLGDSFDFLHLGRSIAFVCHIPIVSINFLSPQLAGEFQQRWHGHRMARPPSSSRRSPLPPLAVVANSVQGRDANMMLVLEASQNVPVLKLGSERMSEREARRLVRLAKAGVFVRRL